VPDTDQTQNAVSFLLEQHDEIRRLFDEVEQSSGDARKEAFEALVRLLAVHETAEEEIVYPALSSVDDDGDAIAATRKAEEDQAKKDLVDLERMGPASPDFEIAFKSFKSSVDAHASSEESEVFPLLVSSFDEGRLQQMANALRVAEQVAPTHPHKMAPESAVGNLVVGPFVAVVDRVRDALRSAAKP